MPAPTNRLAPHDFGRMIRDLRPCADYTGAPGALADWHRRVALSMLPRLGMRVGSKRATAYILGAGL